MRISRWNSASATAVVILGIGLLLSATATPPRPQAAQTTVKEIALSVEPSRSQVHWSVESTLHAVHGTFAVKSGAFQLDPSTGKSSGEIIVSAESGESGNSSRDEKMHNDVLEVGTYPDVIFRPTQLDGKFSTSGGSDITVHGAFVLHGGSHDIAVPVHAEFYGSSWKGSGKFEVPYIQWGLKNPSNFLLKVQPLVEVDLDLAGTWQSGK